MPPRGFDAQRGPVAQAAARGLAALRTTNKCIGRAQDAQACHSGPVTDVTGVGIRSFRYGKRIAAAPLGPHNDGLSGESGPMWACAPSGAAFGPCGYGRMWACAPTGGCGIWARWILNRYIHEKFT